MKKRTFDHHEGVSGLLDHIEILKDNILSIKAPTNFSIATKEDAAQTIHEIKRLQEKVIQYQNTARVLRESLEKEYCI
jgi:hypothetical protein